MDPRRKRRLQVHKDLPLPKLSDTPPEENKVAKRDGTFVNIKQEDEANNWSVDNKKLDVSVSCTLLPWFHSFAITSHIY